MIHIPIYLLLIAAILLLVYILNDQRIVYKYKLENREGRITLLEKQYKEMSDMDTEILDGLKELTK